MLNLGILISGSGTNLQAIVDAVAAGALEAKVCCVVSSRPDAYGIERARQARIPVLVMNKEKYADRAAADAEIRDYLLAHGVDTIAMAGYMRLVTPVILDAFPNHVINLHPALLPKFPGAHAIQDAFEAHEPFTGVTVHIANEEYDKGRILSQQKVPINFDDTLETLEARVHAVEHTLYSESLQMISCGEIVL